MAQIRATNSLFLDDIQVSLEELPFIPVSDEMATGEQLFFTKEERETLSHSIPQHIAIIPDGNRRWSRAHDATLVLGYSKGAYSLVETALAAKELGVQWMTAYFFSTENWKRSPEEVALLMKVIEWHLLFYQEAMKKAHITIRTIGDLSKVPESLQQTIQMIQDSSKSNPAQFVLTLAINYGGRDEIVRAFRSLIASRTKDELLLTINESLISDTLDTASMPEPELLIRTSGEKRVSNFLLWQSSYSEIYIDNTYWPDYSPKNLFAALTEYQHRERRVGGNVL
ncbi:MAG: polyprenyl diphosphate synthase [Chlamydia sp.]